MQTPRNGFSLSQSCSCTPNIFLTPTSKLYERHNNVKEKHIDDACQEINLALVCSSCSSETSNVHKSCRHERTKNNLSPVGGVIQSQSTRKKRRHSKISTAEKLVLSGGKRQYMQKSSVVSRHLTERARTTVGSRFKGKSNHHADLKRKKYFKSCCILSDPYSYILRPRTLRNASKNNEKMHYINSNSTEKPDYVISSKAQHTSRSGILSDIAKILAEPSKLSVEFQIRGSLSFDEKISQQPCSHTAKLITYVNNTAKGIQQTSSVHTLSERSKRISKQLCYCAKVFSISTDFIDNAVTHTCACERQHVRAETWSAYTRKGISDNLHPKKHVADLKVQNGKGRKVKYGNEVQIFYVFNKPLQRPPVTKNLLDCVDSCACAFCQTDPVKTEGSFFKRRKAETQTRGYKDTFTSFFHTVLEPVECDKSTCINLSKINMKAPNVICTCAEAETQSHRYKSDKRNNMECECDTSKLNQVNMKERTLRCTCAEATTQSRKYEDSYQRAGREYFYRDKGTSGYPKYTNNREESELQEVSIDEIEYENGGESKKPATINRRVSTRNNEGVFKKLCHTLLKPMLTKINHKCVNASVICRLSDRNNDIDVLENINQYAPRCAHSSSLCRIDGIKNYGGYIQIFQMLIEPKRNQGARKCKNRGTYCQGGGIIYEDNPIKRLCQVLIEPNESKSKANKFRKKCPYKTVFTEATTQSRKYGAQQQRAGKEIFCRNRGTSGVPRQRCTHIKEEEPVYEIIEDYGEEPFVEPECTNTNKEIGIGTNCNFTIGWFKDRLAYGEPKPQDAINNTKIAIEQWREAPLKQVQRVNTKIGTSLKTSSKCHFFCTSTGTQSRKYRNRDLRTGRERFFKERQTSCVSKCKKPPIDGIYNGMVVQQPLEPPAPDRKAVRLGSDCSFCFEFYRDVPPESPPSKVDESQRNKSVLSKFIRPWRAMDSNVTAKIDACTCMRILGEDSQSTKHEQDETSTPQPSVVPKYKGKSKRKECRCKGKKKKILKPSQISDQPLHIGSSVKFNFNFFKSISPPKRTHVLVDDIKDKCSCGVLTSPQVQSDIASSTQGIEENKRVASVLSECDPSICKIGKSNDIGASSPNTDDLTLAEFIKSIKTMKKCVLEFISKKNFKRLISGEKEQPEIKKPEIENPEIKEALSENVRLSRKNTELICGAKCSKIDEEPREADKSDKPFRIGSSFSFGYDLKNVEPKHEEQKFEEKFPEPKDFKGSRLKTDLCRLIRGKIKKRIRPKSRVTAPIRSHLSIICDPRECKKRKEMDRTWFTYILDNIRHPRHDGSGLYVETKNFFKNILFGKPKRGKTCCKRKRDDDGWFSYILANIKQERHTIPDIEKDAERFFKELLSEETEHFISCNCKRRRRRHRRKQMPYGEYRAMFSAPNKLIDSDPDLSDWSPKSQKRTKDKTPYRVRTDCCCSYKYRNKGSRKTERESSDTGSESINYATT